jgi:hypothetical protein
VEVILSPLSALHSLSAARHDTKGLANIFPSRKQGESLTEIDYAALDWQREEERRQRERDRVLEAVGLTEAAVRPPIGEGLQQALQDPSRLHISASFSRLPATGLHVDERMAVVRHWHRCPAWQALCGPLGR